MADRFAQFRYARPIARWLIFGLVMFSFVMIFSGQCALDRNVSRAYPSRPLPHEPEATLLPPPPIDDEYLPCDDCHEDEPTKLKVRELEDHDEVELDHGDLWCLDCHGVENHEKLQISQKRLVDLTDSWRLCTRCHHEKLPDWRAGVHGKRTGQWHGDKEYQTCVGCHRPHSPSTGPLEPKPRPRMAREIVLSRGTEAEEVSRGED